MLKIRAEQVPPLVGEPAEDYEQHALAYVRRHYPQELERRGEAEIRALIARAIGHAVALRLESSVDVTGLLSLMLLLGDDVLVEPRYAWMHEILGSTVIHPSEKIGMILDALAE